MVSLQHRLGALRTFLMASLVCLLAGSPAHAASYQIDRPRITLGEALTLTLNANPGELEKLDLTPLTSHFELRGRTLNRSEQSESLTLTLYPLHAGQIDLPALELPNLSPPKRALSVQVDSESDKIPKIHFSLTSDPVTPSVRQPARLTLEICDDGSLDWKRPLLPTRAGVYLRVLGEQQTSSERDGEPCTAHRWHWRLLATSAGPIDLALPMLEANKFGQQLRFPPPTATLSAAPLPEWLPTEVSIGKPTIAADPAPTNWPVQRPLAWRIKISGGYSPDTLKALIALQLSGHAPWQHFPPSIEYLPPETPDIATPRYAITLFALPEQTGMLIFPDLTLPWFDPAGASLQTVALRGPHVNIENPLHAQLRWIAIAVAGLIAIALLARIALRALRWRRARRQGIAAITRANDISSLALAVRGFNLTSTTPRTTPRTTARATTLGTWQTQQNLHAAGLEALITQLESACYGSEPLDFSSLKNQAKQVLARARPG